MIDNFLKSTEWATFMSSIPSTTTYPPYNLYKMEEDFYLELAVAGFKREDIAVSLVEGSLEIIGSRGAADSGKAFLVRNLASRSFSRKFSLNRGWNVTEAELVDGILRVKLLPPEAPAKQTIEIK